MLKKLSNYAAHVLGKEVKVSLAQTTLDLEYNSIRDDRAQVLAEAIKSNSPVTTVNMQKKLYQRQRSSSTC